MASVSGTRRIPVEDDDGDTVGWVMFDAFVDFVNIDGSVYVPTEFLLRFPGDDEQPSLTISFTVRDGATAVSGVNLEAKPGGRRVQRADLEGLATVLHEWTDMAVKAVMRHGEATDDTLTVGGHPLQAREATRAASVGRKRAHRKVNDAFLREVAKLYQDGTDTGRYSAIMERFGTDVEPTVARWVGLARKAGHLPPVTKKGSK